MNKINIQIQKCLLGDPTYNINEKFCAMITYLPSNVEKGILEDFFYLNFGEGNSL